MRDLGMTSKYNNDANFSVLIKMILSLASVPIEDLDIAIDLLADELPDEKILLLDWFEEYYISRKKSKKILS
jgi:hypothetical protein